MHKFYPIVIVEDDEDDKFIFEDVLKQLEVKNELIWFANTKLAYDFLHSSDKAFFLIFCDVNLPGKNGFDFKRDIDLDPAIRDKAIPFIFYSTSARRKDVSDSFTTIGVQGFFKKRTDHGQSMKQIKAIIDYWSESEHPTIESYN